MSEQDPQYSKNPILDGIEHVGHALHVVFNDGLTLEQKLPQYIDAADDVVKDTPTIVADVTSVVTAATGGYAIYAAVVAAVEGFGANPVADEAALAALVAQAANAGTYLATLKAKVTQLLTDLGADAATIEAVFTTPAPTVTGS